MSLDKSPLGEIVSAFFPFILSYSSASASFSLKLPLTQFLPFSSLFKPIILTLPRESRVYVKPPPIISLSRSATFSPSPTTRHVTLWVHLQATHSYSLCNPFGHYLPRAGLSLLFRVANSRNQLKSDSELRVISSADPQHPPISPLPLCITKGSCNLHNVATTG